MPTKAPIQLPQSKAIMMVVRTVVFLALVIGAAGTCFGQCTSYVPNSSFNQSYTVTDTFSFSYTSRMSGQGGTSSVQSSYSQTVPDPYTTAQYIGLNTNVFQSCNGTFNSGSVTFNAPFSPPPAGCNIPYTYTYTAVAADGTLTLTITGTDNNNVQGMAPPACPQTFTSLSGTTVHTLVYNIATGAFRETTSDNYDFTSYDSQNNYSDSVSGGGSASGVWPVSGPIQISPPSQLSVGAGLPYNGFFTATGGTGPYTWCVLAGSGCDPNPGSPALLPSGFTLLSLGLLESTGSPIASAGNYPFTVQVTDSIGSTSTQAVTLQISCPINVTFEVLGQSVDGLPIALYATFIPPNGQTVQGYAKACGFSNFDWAQTITSWPAPPAGYTANQPGLLFAQNNQTVALSAPPSFSDPVLGGYTYQYTDPLWPITLPNFPTAYPFYYSTLDFQNGCAAYGSGQCFVPVESSGGTALNFFDQPISPQCGGQNDCIALQTQLIGICDAASTSPLCTGSGESSPLSQWSWTTNATCIAGAAGVCTLPGGGISTSSVELPPVGAESGGVTITGINGVPSPTVSVTPSASTIYISTAVVSWYNGWPIFGRVGACRHRDASEWHLHLGACDSRQRQCKHQHSRRFTCNWFRYADSCLHTSHGGFSDLQPGVGDHDGDGECHSDRSNADLQSTWQYLHLITDGNYCGFDPRSHNLLHNQRYSADYRLIGL